MSRSGVVNDTGTSRDTPDQVLANKRGQVLVELGLLLETVRRVGLVLSDIEAMTAAHDDEEDDHDGADDLPPRSGSRERAQTKKPSAIADAEPSGISGADPNRSGEPQVADRKPASIFQKQRMLLDELERWSTA
jgi:hypothetical protein